jgi:hypothetical protein
MFPYHLPTMDDEDYPTHASAAPIELSDDILCRPNAQDCARWKEEYEAEEAEKAALEARIIEETKVDLAETPLEIWHGVSTKKHLKAVKATKASAKKLVKTRKIYKISSHFNRL